ncbi:MAG: hypothetical protein Q4C56_04120 [Peptococcaceae bacterium]|nr:hypothetical protein [Peptococcaceae bacterium]
MNRESLSTLEGLLWRGVKQLETKVNDLEESITQTVDTAIAALAARVVTLEQRWHNLEAVYPKKVTTLPSNTTGEKTYREVLYDAAGAEQASRVTTESADGRVFTEVYTIDGTTKTHRITVDSTGLIYTEEWI